MSHTPTPWTLYENSTILGAEGEVVTEVIGDAASFDAAMPIRICARSAGTSPLGINSTASPNMRAFPHSIGKSLVSELVVKS